MAEPTSRPLRRNAVALGDLVPAHMQPVLRKRGFATADLVLNWPQIVGPSYAKTTMPDQISWPRRPKGVIGSRDEPEPGILTIRCIGAMALRITHDAPLLMERINTYFGYRAVGRIKVLQAPLQMARLRPKPVPAPLQPEEIARVDRLCGPIEDDGLRSIMAKLGENIRKRRRDAGIVLRPQA